MSQPAAMRWCPRCSERLILTAAGVWPAVVCQGCGYGALALWFNPMEKSMDAVNEAKREPAIPLVVGRVARQVEELDALCAMLEKRVAMVSNPSSPTVAKDPDRRPAAAVPLVGQLESINDRLQMVGRRLRDQIDRIELPAA